MCQLEIDDLTCEMATFAYVLHFQVMLLNTLEEVVDIPK
jgi:hypothetical protein